MSQRQMLPGQMSPCYMTSGKDAPKAIPKLGQNWFSNSSDVADIENVSGQIMSGQMSL